jgi:hypothetical protein
MLVLLAAAGAASAEESGATLAPGDRVRVTCPTLARSPIVGTLKSAGAPELIIERDGAPMTLHRDAVVAFEKSLGRRSRWSTRIAGSLLAGTAATAYVVGLNTCTPFCQLDDATGMCVPADPCAHTRWDSARDVAVLAAGTAAGYALGSLFKTEKWKEVGAPPLTLEAAPTRRGARVALRFSF